MGKYDIWCLGMGGSKLTAAPTHCANDHRQLHLPAEHEMHFSSLIHDVIESREGEIDRHHFSHRAESGQRRANRAADNGCLRDRSILDTVGSKVIIETLGYRISAAPDTDLLTHNEYFRVAFHLFPQGL